MTKNENLDRKFLLDIANEYRQQGYEVLISPNANQRPKFMQDFQPDIIALSAEKNILIEVRSSTTLTKSPSLNDLALKLTHHNQWQLDLVVTNPDGYHIHQNENLLNSSDIQYRLREARQLSEQEHGEAAFLLTWSTLEAILRRFRPPESTMEIQDNPLYLIKSLFTYGLLSEEQYRLLKSGAMARNAIIHGYKNPQSLVSIMNDLLTLADQLADQPLTA